MKISHVISFSNNIPSREQEKFHQPLQNFFIFPTWYQIKIQLSTRILRGEMTNNLSPLYFSTVMVAIWVDSTNLSRSTESYRRSNKWICNLSILILKNISTYQSPLGTSRGYTEATRNQRAGGRLVHQLGIGESKHGQCLKCLLPSTLSLSWLEWIHHMFFTNPESTNLHIFVPKFYVSFFWVSFSIIFDLNRKLLSSRNTKQRKFCKFLFVNL